MRRKIIWLLTIVVIAGAIQASAQWRGRRAPIRYPDPDQKYAEGFVFCRGQYEEIRSEWLGQG